MHWKLKGVLQKSLTFLPKGQALNDHLQLRFGGLRDFEENIAEKVGDWTLSLRYLRDCDFDVCGKTLCEIGSGWYPTLPICFHLAGVKRVISYDVVSHTDADLTFRMIRALKLHLGSIADACGVTVDEVRHRYDRLGESNHLKTVLNVAGVELCAPADARTTDLLSDSIDLVYSNSVMEHVPKEVIREIMGESFRILRPGGLALHNVACNDHYAHIDSSISFVNFLQYDEPQWRMWNNALQYQNRLRAPEFLDLATDAGLEVIYKKTFVRPGTVEALRRLDVAPQFRNFSDEDLAATTVDFVARKPTA
jgi:SAM-dependent methyltransferase